MRRTSTSIFPPRHRPRHRIPAESLRPLSMRKLVGQCSQSLTSNRKTLQLPPPFRRAFSHRPSSPQTSNHRPSHQSGVDTCPRPVMPASLVGDETKTVSSRANHADHADYAAAKLSNGHASERMGDEARDLSEACAKVHQRVYEFLSRSTKSERICQVQRMARESLDVIGEALRKYSLDELSFSYNGGKDCLVLLILYLTALHTHSTRTSTPLPPVLPSVYIVSPNPFPAVTSFVQTSAAKYHLSLSQYHKSMREAFASYLSDFPSIRAIFVGTRRTDPHGANLTHFDLTDGGWPKFMRIHPVIDWHYADIWGFIREVGVEYCELYDMGYTSLGGTDDTHPNPALAVKAGGTSGVTEGSAVETVVYRPAYELIEDDEERLGRDGKQVKRPLV